MRGHRHANDRARRERAGGRCTAALLLALLGLWGLVAAGALAQGAAAPAGDPSGFEIQITECGDVDTEPAQCQAAPTQVVEARPVPAEPKPDRPPSARPPGSPAPQEVQSYDLKTGEGTVVTDDGARQEEILTLESKVREQSAPDAREPAPAPVLPTVQTGGSPFAGFGSAFEYVSTDEALSRFAIPPFLQPIYVAAGQAYGVPWNVLAAINAIETDFGRIENQVSYAGALGWMQFMPGTWRMYGVDATGDGVADPWNPVDAIYAAARYLAAAGAATDLRKAIFAYNRANWYVDQVLQTASVYASLPPGLVAETGSLAFGRFPLRGEVTYGDDFRRVQAQGGRARGLRLRGEERARAIATQDVRITEILLAPRLARALRREERLPERGLTELRAAPGVAAQPASEPAAVFDAGGTNFTSFLETLLAPVPQLSLEVLQAEPQVRARASAAPKRLADGLPRGFGRSSTRGLTVVVTDALDNTYSYEGLSRLRSGLRPGSRLDGGATIGYVGDGDRAELVFVVRAAGGALIDPRPLVDGYRLQEAAGFQKAIAATGANPFLPTAGSVASVALSGTDRELARRVLDEPGISIYPCGREDVARGNVDRRILGTLLYLRRAGITTTVTSLTCGHSYLTASGNVSAHSYGAAVDIAAFNGQPVIGNQGPGSLTEQVIRLLMQLEGTAAPSQLISLMNLGGPSFALADHADHLHVGFDFQPSLGIGRTGAALGDVSFTAGGGVGGFGNLADAKPDRGQEQALSERFATIDNPKVPGEQGTGALRVDGEAPTDVARAERAAALLSPLRSQPTAAGAEIIDADVAGGTAYAIGEVDGAGRQGWAARQVALLANRDGAWRVVGVPRDAAGDVVSPDLTAIAALPGGRAYAVGDKGAAVALRDGRVRVLESGTKTDLLAVDARRVDDQGVAYAVGREGTALRLTGPRAVSERSGSDTLRAVTIGADGTPLAVSSPLGSPVLHRRTGGTWSSSPAGLPLPAGAGVRIAALAESAEGLWAVGGIEHAPATGAGVSAPFVGRLSGGRWTTWCAGAPALTAIRELGTPTPRACDSTLYVDPATMGPAGDVAVTRRGVVVATPAGLLLKGKRGFRHIPDVTSGAGSTPARYARLALGDQGEGWAVAAGGAMIVVRRAGATPAARLQRVAVSGPAQTLNIAVSESAEPVVTADGAAAAMGAAAPAEPSGLELRELAVADDGTTWALEASTGALVRYDEDGWSATGESDEDAAELRDVLGAMGGERLGEAAVGAGGAGFRDITFTEGVGLAVGKGGALRGFMAGEWRGSESPTDETLNAVALAGTGALAAGDNGTLIESSGDGWRVQSAAGTLVDGADFSAVGLGTDGSRVAAAGGALIARRGEGDWQVADLDPLGLAVRDLQPYRRDGDLRVLALVDAGPVTQLLDGGPEGWTPVGERLGMAISDFAFDGATGGLWVTGRTGHGAVAGELRLDEAGRWRPVPEGT